MRFWLASTNPDIVGELASVGLFEGVLTNPTMFASAERSPQELIPELCRASHGPVFYQLAHGKVEDMKAEAATWLELGIPNLGIKVPLTRAGCTVLHWLSEQKVTNRLGTCAPTLMQIVLATALALPWVTPAGSILERSGGTPKFTLLNEMQKLIEQQGGPTQIIPSLSSPSELCALASLGVRNGFIWERDVNSFLNSELVSQLVDSFSQASDQLKIRNAY